MSLFLIQPTPPSELSWTVQGMIILLLYIIATQILPKIADAWIARINAGTSRQLAATETIKDLKKQLESAEKRIDELEDMIRGMRSGHADEMIRKNERIAYLETKLKLAGIEP